MGGMKKIHCNEEVAEGEVGTMLDLKTIVARKMRGVSIIMVAIILLLSSAIQVYDTMETANRNASLIFDQIGQILEENSQELERVRQEYGTMCLNSARTVAYILEHNPAARSDVEELRKIAANEQVDEIDIFDNTGTIISGTNPDYIGYSFDSGEQISFFEPLLEDYTLELVQDIVPNTAEGKLMQYSALWSEDRTFIAQIGMYPSTVLRFTQKNELSYIFSLFRSGAGYSLYAVNQETEEIAGSTNMTYVGKNIAEIGFEMEQLESGSPFLMRVNQTLSYCMARPIGESYVVWTTPVSGLVRTPLVSGMLMLVGLVLIALKLDSVVHEITGRTVIDRIGQINDKLRTIQNGDLTTRVDIGESHEFMELSAHINSMVDSLLRNSEQLKLTEKIKSQNEELEKQREQLKAALAQAESASKAKSEFLFNMSHDIRTPMNAIIGFTNFALESNDLEAQREYLKNIDVASKQLLGLVNNILELARIEHRKIIVEEDLVNVKENCDKLCMIFQSNLKQKNLELSVKIEVSHPYVYMDEIRYAQIFQNLVSNAIKYTPDGGHITIFIREWEGDAPGTCEMETTVQDDGIGMSEEFLAQAFESFSRERTSTVSGIQGTGLGLTIVKELVELMRGTVHLESKQGQGTTVTVRLPHRLGEAPAEKICDSADNGCLKGMRILLAEDIDINAVITTKLLVSRGCTVDRARDGVECVDMLLKAEPGYYALVLMDIQMPNMNGYQATKVIRAFENKEKATIPILALTANAFKEDCEKAAEMGMNGHVAKPLDAAKLFQAIMNVMQRERA